MRLKKQRFQFPTGWNSTLALAVILTSFEWFQFPTGWNSTQYENYNFVNMKSFNSQRDGILPRIRVSFLVAARVSIPNGMEFY